MTGPALTAPSKINIFKTLSSQIVLGVFFLITPLPLHSNQILYNLMKKPGVFTVGKKIREAEKNLTKGLIRWKLKKEGLTPPPEEILEKKSEQVVDNAHRIIKRGSARYIEEIKHAKEEFIKAYRDKNEDKKK